MTPSHLRRALRCLRRGGIVAYPTEAVWGLGCDPDDGDAVQRVLAIKQRPATRGLILLADDFGRLAPYLAPLPDSVRQRVSATWPGPVTWLLPAAPGTPRWLTGDHATIAVRVSAHPPAAELARAFGKPLVSTSANRSGRPPARTLLALRLSLGNAVDYVLPAPTGGGVRPSEIRDGLSGRILRPA